MNENYKLIYEKQYGSIFRNPLSVEELKRNELMQFGGSDYCLWIKSGDNAYCFINNYDKVQDAVDNLPAFQADEYLKNNNDRMENIKEVTNKWIGM